MDRNGNTIYAVDFDGTLSFGKWPDTGEPNEALFRFLKREKENGARIILYTCRRADALDMAVRFCSERGLHFDTVNENLPDQIELYGGDTRKINADFYIDDKAVNPNAGYSKRGESYMLFGKNKDTKRELVEAFETVEEIRSADSRYETILYQGFAMGVITQKIESGKLSGKTGTVIMHMAEALAEEMLKSFAPETEETEAGETADLIDIEME